MHWLAREYNLHTRNNKVEGAHILTTNETGTNRPTFRPAGSECFDISDSSPDAVNTWQLIRIKYCVSPRFASRHPIIALILHTH